MQPFNDEFGLTKDQPITLNVRSQPLLFVDDLVLWLHIFPGTHVWTNRSIIDTDMSGVILHDYSQHAFYYTVGLGLTTIRLARKIK